MLSNQLVNSDNSHWPGGFGSIETSKPYALQDKFSSNYAAVNASQIGGSKFMGGSKFGFNFKKKTIRRKIKNIVNKYRMYSKKMRKNTKRRLMNLYKKKGKKSKGHRFTRRRQRGGNGYLQFQSNVPMTQTYSTGGILGAKESALANPVPYKVLPNCTNCADNLNYSKVN